jgi:hypothetical protein
MQAVASTMRPGNVIYELLYVGFIFFFCYFYTAVTFNPADVADNMKKTGRIYSRYSSRKAHGRLYRQGLNPHNTGWRDICFCGVRSSINFNSKI